jgi:hypothetical protein
MSTRGDFRGPSRGGRGARGTGRGGRGAGRGNNTRTDTRNDTRPDTRNDTRTNPRQFRPDNRTDTRNDTRNNPRQFRPDTRNEAPERGYDQYINKAKPPPAVFFLFDGVHVPNRFGNVNLKTVNVSDLSEDDRLKIIDDAYKIIRNFSLPESCSGSEQDTNQNNSANTN